jgi:hypothetical protein
MAEGQVSSPSILGIRIFKITPLMFHFVCHKERWATAPLDSHIYSEFHPTPRAIKQTSFLKDCVQTEGRKWTVSLIR